MHNHNCVCEHENVRYCKHCRVVYCVNCSQEWGTYNHQWYWPYNTYIGSYSGTLAGGSSGYIQTLGNDLEKNSDPHLTTTCNHK